MRLVHCSGVIVLLLLAVSVSAEVELTIDDAKCIEPSGVYLLATNHGQDELSASRIKVQANYFSSLAVGVDEKGVDKKFIIPVLGTWERSPIATKDGPIAFRSAQNTLTYPGEYKITLSYEGCKSSYQKCEATTRVTCPGVKEYGCEAYPLKIESCKNIDDVLYINFYNFEKGLLMDIDPYKDIKYIFYGDKYHLDNELPNTTIKEESGDRYVLKMNLMNGNRVGRIKMEHRICGHILYSNCKIEGSSVLRPLNISEENKTVYIPPPGSNGQIFSNELIYLVAVIFVITILFIIYQIRRRS